MAPLFNPFILGKNEVMMQENALEFFGAVIGDTVTMYLDITYNDTLVNETAPQSASNFHRALAFASTSTGHPMPDHIHHILKASSDVSDVVIVQDFVVAATYDKANGKFPSAYGNVALIDCTYVLDYLFDFAEDEYAQTIDNPVTKAAFLVYLDALENNVTESGSTFCNYGFTIEGVLKNQAEVYMNTYNDIVDIIQHRARSI